MVVILAIQERALHFNALYFLMLNRSPTTLWFPDLRDALIIIIAHNHQDIPETGSFKSRIQLQQLAQVRFA